MFYINIQLHIHTDSYIKLYVSVSFVNILSLCIHKMKIPVSSEFT